MDVPDASKTVLRARIALLATAIGGPDYTSSIEPPPYKLGDDCLACLKDLKRWFKLVDDQQNRWDVAMAAAEYKIVIDDLLPILIDWENRSAQEAKIARKHRSNVDKESEMASPFTSKNYFDKVALHCLQLLVLMTWPLILTDQSTMNQVNNYAELKKYQLLYKKMILSMSNGKALKAVIRLALNVVKIDRLSRTPRDNVILKLALNFFRNIIAIEPGELMITKRKIMPRGINSVDTLPPNVSMDDISLTAVIDCFQQNKVFGFLLTLSNSLNSEFDQDFINIPLLEIMFYLTKDLNQKYFFRTPTNKLSKGSNDSTHEPLISAPQLELSELLKKEQHLKMNLVKNTSSRHSRFGALLSIETPDKVRLTVSGSQHLLNDAAALQKLDGRKKWKKRVIQSKDDVLEEGLPNSLLNSQSDTMGLRGSTLKVFTKFINSFIDTSFNILLHSVTNHFTTEQDRLITLEQVEYLLFFSWFLKYQNLRSMNDHATDISAVSEALRETSFIFVSHLLRSAYELKNWIVVHAGMIAFNELLILVGNEKSSDEDLDDIEFIISRLFGDERIQLLSNLPKTASKHSLQYMKSCVNLTHTVLKALEQYSTNDNKLIVAGKGRRRHKANITKQDIETLMEQEDIDRDEALDILSSRLKEFEVNFKKVQASYVNDPTIDMYINFLQRYRELDHGFIKKVIAFFHRIFIQAKEETYLFRIDLIILLRDILSMEGLERTARVRRHVEEFSNHYLHRLKDRLKKSPAWFIGLLFPSLHDSEVGYFQRYGENKILKREQFYGVPPSRFKNIKDAEALPKSVLKDMKFGIIVSAMIDDGKIELLEELKEHLKNTLNVFKAWLTVNVSMERETENPPNEYFKSVQEPRNPLLLDKDLRALLLLCDYLIPMTASEKCYLPGTVEITTLEESLTLIEKYMTTSFETPNGLPSSSYLIRPQLNMSYDNPIDEDGWNGHDSYDYDDPSIVRDSDVSDNDNDYFKDLDGTMDEKLRGRKVTKGLATSKKVKHNKKRPKKNLPKHDIEQNIEEQSKKKSHQAVSSREYISDSDDEDDAMTSIFFENENYMRWLLDRHNGQLTDEMFKLFGKFTAERMQNHGSVTSDFSALFQGPVPSIDAIKVSTVDSLAPKTLIDFSYKVTETNDNANETEHSSEEEFVDKHAPSSNSIENNQLDERQTTSKNEDQQKKRPRDNESQSSRISEDTSEELSDDGYKSEDEEGIAVVKKKSKIIFSDDDE
ncbi:hypothetical protein KAFR_0D03970 [Kazachstania africana CBS 2517]|uniref:Topoisomerase 1-associated factor 1 n=1 Tax=Kazachstania africana (strain ATCC 22294 / BCRC 22015 / CBS 2517 / CECT 1963 / NBRC 1671 / NRRL Y-8276) TaxID=1071382 RepID=H2AUJ5_KAZAF|nr:hypothetical protein KAFR_0D03970 [Kazachstania africana CBS 2517]CCF58045.1 hypothetical protein KAFR_0D03970 [Kazachstania africana CBS 2517]